MKSTFDIDAERFEFGHFHFPYYLPAVFWFFRGQVTGGQKDIHDGLSVFISEGRRSLM